MEDGTQSLYKGFKNLLFLIHCHLNANNEHTRPPSLILLKETASLLCRKIPNDRTSQQLESYPDVLHF